MNFEITTERLYLKPPSLVNKDQLFDLMSKQVDTRFLSWKPHTEIETTIQLINNLIESQNQGKAFHWCVYLEDQIIGLVSLIDVKRQIRTWTLNRAELSYWLSNQYIGNGFATEASKVITDFGFKNLSLHKILIAHVKENFESEKICHKLGFVEYAYEKDAFMKNKKWHDLVWYQLLKN